MTLERVVELVNKSPVSKGKWVLARGPFTIADVEDGWVRGDQLAIPEVARKVLRDLCEKCSTGAKSDTQVESVWENKTHMLWKMSNAIASPVASLMLAPFNAKWKSTVRVRPCDFAFRIKDDGGIEHALLPTAEVVANQKPHELRDSIFECLREVVGVSARGRDWTASKALERYENTWAARIVGIHVVNKALHEATSVGEALKRAEHMQEVMGDPLTQFAEIQAIGADKRPDAYGWLRAVPRSCCLKNKLSDATAQCGGCPRPMEVEGYEDWLQLIDKRRLPLGDAVNKALCGPAMGGGIGPYKKLESPVLEIGLRQPLSA